MHFILAAFRNFDNASETCVAATALPVPAGGGGCSSLHGIRP